MQKIKVMLLCYRYILVPSIAITLFESFMIIHSGSLSSLFYVVLTKVFTTASLLLFIHLFRTQGLYLFNNLGYSKLTVFSLIAFVDFSIAGISFFVAYQLI